MFGRNRLSREERAGADELQDYLDSLARRHASQDGQANTFEDPVVARVYTAARRSKAPSPLKAGIWEELMNQAAPSNGSQPSRRPDPTPSRFTRALNPVRLSEKSRNRNVFAVVTVTVLTLSLVAAYLSIIRGGENGNGGETSMLAPLSSLADGSPAAETAEQAAAAISSPTTPNLDPANCTVETLRLNEISAILDYATRGIEFGGSQQRNMPAAVLDNSRLLPPLPDGFALSDEVAAEIMPVYNMYWFCESAGSRRQQLFLFTDSGVARQLLNPDGTPVWANVVAIGVAPTPVAAGEVTRIPEIISMRMLGDGRVVVTYVLNSSQDAPSYFIFKLINDRWYIDETYCGNCG